MLASSSINILVLDIDCMSLTDLVANEAGLPIPNPRDDLLSQDVIDEGRKEENGIRKHTGFYICTIRYSATITFPFWNKTLNCYKTNLKRDFDPRNLLMISVVKNLEAALDLPCLGVGTLDDLSETAPAELHLKTGYGFINITMPIEAKLLELNKRNLEEKIYSGYALGPLPIDEKHKPFRVKSGVRPGKNPLLKLIGYHASARHPAHRVNLHFWDDEFPHFKNACELPREELPHNIQYRMTWHEASENILCPLGVTIQGSAPLPVPGRPASFEIEKKETNILTKVSVFKEVKLKDPDISEKEKLIAQPQVHIPKRRSVCCPSMRCVIL